MKRIVLTVALTTALLPVVLGALALLPASAAAADDVPDFWVGINNGMAVYGWTGGQLTVPYVVAHVAEAEVSSTLVIFKTRGPTHTVVATVPMGTVKAVGKYFCNMDTGGALPFTFVWDGVTLDPGSYECRMTADDGTAQAESGFDSPVTIFSTPDTTPPVDTTADYDGLWHRRTLGITLSVVDDPQGWGAGGGLVHVDCSLDDGVTWWRAGNPNGEAVFPIRKRGWGSGVYTLLYRGTDAAGNEEATSHSVTVFMDGRAPVTTDDAPVGPQAGDVTVRFTAADDMFGVTACSGIAATWYSVDGGRWLEGGQVVVPAARNAGTHWIAYYSTDVAGNAEYVKWCSVTIAAQSAGGHAARSRLSR